MTSYEIYELFDYVKTNYNKLKQTITENNFLKSSLELKEGIKSNSYVSVKNRIYFTYCFQTKYSYPDIEGDSNITTRQDVNVILLNDKYLAIGAGKKFTSDSIIRTKVFTFLQNKILGKFYSKQLKLVDSDFRWIYENFDPIPGVRIIPQSMDDVDSLDASAINIKGSSFSKRYLSNPISKIKLFLEEFRAKVTLHGSKTTINKKSFTIEDDTKVIEFILENIFNPTIVKRKSSQSILSFKENELISKRR